MDSRFLLGTLIDAGLRQDILTVTFSVPGTFDFELAPRVAKAAGVKHEAINLSALEVDRGKIMEAVCRAPWTPVFESLYNRLIPERYGPTATYWSGFMANSMSGVDLVEASDTWEVACRQFARNCQIVKTTDLTPPGFKPHEALPKEPLLEDTCFTYYEQLFMFLRHPRRNEPALVPDGYDFRTPFRHPAWVNFILRVPHRYRLHQSLYYRMVRRAQPALFTLPTKNALGLPLDAPAWRTLVRRAGLKAIRELRARFPRMLKGPNPKLNYEDFDHALRRPGALREAVFGAVAELERRELLSWLDLPHLTNRHRELRSNHGDALTHLAVLELNLAASGGTVEL